MSGFARRRVSHIRGSGEHRAFGAPMNRNCTLWTLRVAWLKAFSLLRFFVALDKEMTCRHAQWLIVIKRRANSGRPLRPKAATRHQPRPLTLEPSNPALTPTANPEPGTPALTPTAPPTPDPQTPSTGANEQTRAGLAIIVRWSQTGHTAAFKCTAGANPSRRHDQQREHARPVEHPQADIKWQQTWTSGNAFSRTPRTS